MSFFRIGIISDTYGLLRPEAERRLAGVDHIVHGGDIGRPEIIDALRRIAPVTAVRGNVDTGGWAREFPYTTRATCRPIHLRRARSQDLADRSRRARHRRDRLWPFPCTEDRHGRRRALLESRKCGPTAFQLADHACDARRHARWPATGHPRPRLNGVANGGDEKSLQWWMWQMGRRERSDELSRCRRLALANAANCLAS